MVLDGLPAVQAIFFSRDSNRPHLSDTCKNQVTIRCCRDSAESEALLEGRSLRWMQGQSRHDDAPVVVGAGGSPREPAFAKRQAFSGLSPASITRWRPAQSGQQAARAPPPSWPWLPSSASGSLAALVLHGVGPLLPASSRGLHSRDASPCLGSRAASGRYTTGC